MVQSYRQWQEERERPTIAELKARVQALLDSKDARRQIDGQSMLYWHLVKLVAEQGDETGEVARMLLELSRRHQPVK